MEGVAQLLNDSSEATATLGVSASPKTKFPTTFIVLIGFIGLILIAGVLCLLYCYCKQKKIEKDGTRRPVDGFDSEFPRPTTIIKNDGDAEEP